MSKWQTVLNIIIICTTLYVESAIYSYETDLWSRGISMKFVLSREFYYDNIIKNHRTTWSRWTDFLSDMYTYKIHVPYRPYHIHSSVSTEYVFRSTRTYIQYIYNRSSDIVFRFVYNNWLSKTRTCT